MDNEQAPANKKKKEHVVPTSFTSRVDVLVQAVGLVE